jgi:hypothetical protein
MKIETFKTITEAINFVLDNNMYHISIPRFEQQLMDKKTYKSVTYNTIFIIDEHLNN